MTVTMASPSVRFQINTTDKENIIIMNRIIFITTLLISGFLLVSQSTVAKTKDSSHFDKIAKKEAKRLNKEGWKTDSYGPSLKDLLINYWEMMIEFDEDGNPKYITESSRGVGTSYEEARNQAIIECKKFLANRIKSEIEEELELRITDVQYSIVNALETLRQSSFVSAELDIIPVMEVYRKPDKNSFEVHIVFGCHRRVIDNAIEHVDAQL